MNGNDRSSTSRPNDQFAKFELSQVDVALMSDALDYRTPAKSHAVQLQPGPSRFREPVSYTDVSTVRDSRYGEHIVTFVACLEIKTVFCIWINLLRLWMSLNSTTLCRFSYVKFANNMD
jgi:hypothetical protein